MRQQRRWQLQQQRMGNCITCGKPRGEHKSQCPDCRRRQLERNRERSANCRRR